MSTIDKCCELVKQLGDVFQEIKAQSPQGTEISRPTNTLTEQDRKKILKLFNYDMWGSYMNWVDEKLEESGEDLESYMEASGVQSVEPTETVKISQSSIRLTTKKEGKFNEESFLADTESEYHLLQKENKKLLGINSTLRKKYEELKSTFAKIMK